MKTTRTVAITAIPVLCLAMTACGGSKSSPDSAAGNSGSTISASSSASSTPSAAPSSGDSETTDAATAGDSLAALPRFNFSDPDCNRLNVNVDAVFPEHMPRSALWLGQTCQWEDSSGDPDANYDTIDLNVFTAPVETTNTPNGLEVAITGGSGMSLIDPVTPDSALLAFKALPSTGFSGAWSYAGNEPTYLALSPDAKRAFICQWNPGGGGQTAINNVVPKVLKVCQAVFAQVKK